MNVLKMISDAEKWRLNSEKSGKLENVFVKHYAPSDMLEKYA